MTDEAEVTFLPLKVDVATLEEFQALLEMARSAVASEVEALRAEIGRLRQELAYHADWLASNACPHCDEPLRWGEYGSDGIVCTCCDRPFQHCPAVLVQE